MKDKRCLGDETPYSLHRMGMAPTRKLPNPESVAVGRRIALARTKVEHTQETLAKVMGVSSAAIAQYETGTTGLTAKRIDQLVRTLGVSMAWLLTGDDPEETVRAHTKPEQESLVIIRNVPAEKQAAYLEAIKAVAKAFSD